MRGEAWDHPRRRVQYRVKGFTVRLPLYAGNGDLKSKVLVVDVPQLVFKRGLLLLRRQTGIDVYVKAPVVIQNRNTFNSCRQRNGADMVFAHILLFMALLSKS